jgi:sugar phosphate isomerase/epimerase
MLVRFSGEDLNGPNSHRACVLAMGTVAWHNVTVFARTKPPSLLISGPPALQEDTAMIRLGICNELFEGWEFGDVCRTVKALGYDGLEIAPFTLAPRITDLTAARRSELRAMVADAGLTTIGLHWLLAKTEGFYLTSPESDVRRRTGDYLVLLAEATKDLGGSLMVLGSPKQRDLLPRVSHDQAVGYASEVFHHIMPAIGAVGIDLCLEPLAPSDTNFLNTCSQANALIAEVNHPHFKLHMDVKAQSGEIASTVPELIRLYARSAGHFHAQDVNLRGPGMGNVDFGPIMKALVNSGYDRWVSVEVFDFSPGAEETARRSIECLRRELAAARADGEFRQ